MNSGGARLDLQRIERLIGKTQAPRRLGEAAALAQRAFLDDGEPRAFNAWARALMRGGQLEQLESLLRAPSDLDERLLSAWRVEAALARCDYCEVLRRAEAHVVSFGPEAEGAPMLVKIAELCRAGELSRQDLRQITGGRWLIASLPDLPKSRPRWMTPDADWMPELAARQARGENRGRLSRMFLAHYDWLNRDPHAYGTLWDVLKGTRFRLFYHVRMAPYLNGEASLDALEAYVVVLYEQKRTADIAFLLSHGAPSWRLALYRDLAHGDLGLSGPDARAPLGPAADAEADYRRLMDLRAKARRKHPPKPRTFKPGAPRRFALCVSGQMRAWRTAIPPLIEQLKAEGEVDVFVSTWKRPADYTRRYAAKQFSGPVLEFMLGLPGPFDTNLFRILPQLREDAAQLRRSLCETLRTEHVGMEDEAAFERRLPERLPGHEAAALNQYKMYHKIHAAWEMQHGHAKSTGVNYDFVIRIRPDYLVQTLPFAEIYDRVDDDTVVAGSYAYEDAFDDRFSIGTPVAMARHAAVWPRILRAGTHRCLPLIKDVLAENLMMAHLLAEGCRPIVLRDLESLSQNQNHVGVADEEIVGMLEDCAAAGPLDQDQITLAAVLAGAHAGPLGLRARALTTSTTPVPPLPLNAIS